jgi:hypothetical protein
MKNILLKFVFFASFNDLILFNNLKILKTWLMIMEKKYIGVNLVVIGK